MGGGGGLEGPRTIHVEIKPEMTNIKAQEALAEAFWLALRPDYCQEV